jgi:crotonobetainyl-CoA:carnitine CoA-transferase CaiB-like acyl-CoA transferase
LGLRDRELPTDPNFMPPLDGVRVLDLTRLLPGAYATLLLADLGADVIKIEDPGGGDSMRHLGARTFFDRFNRGKQSVTLNLRSPQSAAVLDALIGISDVVVDSFRPSTAQRLGVDAVSLHTRHPRLICASINGFGLGGSSANRAAHDINYQALAGTLKPPRLPGPLVGDIGAAMHAALHIVAALLARDRTGAGSVVDVAIYDAARVWAMCPTTDDLESACYNLYETADGRWLALGALEPKFWAGFCTGIGRADLIPLQHAQGDTGRRVLSDVRAIMKSRTRDEWLAQFGDDDVCLTSVEDPAPVQDLDGPALGADTDRILESAGLDGARRAELRAAGVI